MARSTHTMLYVQVVCPRPRTRETSAPALCAL